ncbi:hypothetical protein Bca4012_032885 [Brassica carinata]
MARCDVLFLSVLLILATVSSISSAVSSLNLIISTRTMNQIVSTHSTSPYELTAVRNNCPVSLRESVGRVGCEIRKSLSWIV